MQCPVCRVDLNMSERHGVEIDYCPKCRGVWLDRGELDKIIDQASGPMVPPEPDMPAAPGPRAWQEPDRTAPRERREGKDRYRESDDRYRDRDDRDRDDRDDGYRRKRRRKSILSEIFDFD